jgi:cobalamin biosynthesis protein CobT
MVLNKAECESKFSYLFNTQHGGLGGVRANIIRLLRSVDLVGWSTHEENGRLDRRAFTRFATGSTSIFSRRQHVEATKSAVSVLIDCSGSMNDYGGERIKTAQEIAIQLGKILDKADVSFSVTGFQGTRDADGYTCRAEWSRVVTEYTRFVPFKTWKESLSKASAKLGAIDQCADGGTPDYASLTLALEDLSRQEEQRKILFLLTDADGYNVDRMKKVQSLANKLNIKVIAIGIGNTKVAKCFDVAENVKDVSGLASTSFNKLLKELR